MPTVLCVVVSVKISVWKGREMVNFWSSEQVVGRWERENPTVRGGVCETRYGTSVSESDWA